MPSLELERLESATPEREISPASDHRKPDSLLTSSATINLSETTTTSNSFSDSSDRQYILQNACNNSQPDRGFRSHLQQIFKALGLSAGFNLLAKNCGWPVTEKKKVVMKRNKLKATLRCVVHLVPVSAAIALLILNGSNHYIGGELSGAVGQDTQKLAALLFAAKLHELFMLASLSAMVITYIRKELVFGDGVPFGTVFSATQFKDLTFLWSPELWGTIYHEWEKRRTKWIVISLLVICSVAGLTVGPSTGILMRPRLDEWPAGGTTFWIDATEASLNPDKIEAIPDMSHCSVEDGDTSCPASGWRILNEQYFPHWKSLGGMGAMPQSLFMPGRSSLRQLVLRTRNIRNFPMSLLWANAFTLATVSPSPVADALVDLERLWINAAANSDIGNFKYRRDASFTTDCLQSLVMTRCHNTNYVSGEAVKLRFPSFRNVTLSHGPGSAAHLGSHASFGEWLHIDDTSITSPIEELLVSSGRPSLYWIDDSEFLQKTQTSLMVVATIPKSKAGPAAYHTCSIDSRFANVTLKTSRNSITNVFSAPSGFDNVGTFNSAYRPIKLSADWARYLNPTISTSNQTNDTVFSALAETAGLWASDFTISSEWFPIIVENILATLLTNAIGGANFDKTMVGTLSGLNEPSNPWSLGMWVKQILPQNGRLGYGGNAFNITKDDEAKATRFVMKVRILGYAYSPQGKTQIAAMIALSLYVLLVSIHIGYSAMTGWYSNSWGSPSELTALAMNSAYTSKLENTGGGIETVDVFKERVWVRLKDERAQIVFDDTFSRQKLQDGVAYA
ncbi:hypothetical protein COCSADRAFT_204254 [Bipolaris sorokiniana ND90Pr]|uniref:Uncharacterized protein n=1 Tax=Cochliobolus sativus (strain ND90Pr / ATCC 201652) TaxID=665912 RepID=M2SPH9_COCSN|nr:uncharacterized protein COCSADRAFT_204254 [Bipolaris sorokiniana ND90Pr]EMD58652.1 hypothetical protein COCSADRAFT_204254 [Bipolaris sorokiniana ND90Pr]